jgi:hypothetical protein
VFPSLLEVELNWRMICESGQGVFGRVIDFFIFGTSRTQLVDFIRRERVDAVDDVKVRVQGVAHGSLGVVFSPCEQILF